MRIGIDMTWMKPGKSGGVEIFIKNLLDGFQELEDDNEYILLVAKDNEEDLKSYIKDKRFSFVSCDTYANKVGKHLLWQNLKENKILKDNNISFCYYPVYEMPHFKRKGMKTVTNIHDIQAFHYPKYFKFHERLWFRLAWKNVMKKSDAIVTISNFTRDDLITHYGHEDKIKMIYIPVEFDKSKISDFKKLANDFNIEKNNYYYTLCSMHQHKNLITLLKVIKEIKDRKDIPNKLAISGVGGPNKNVLLKQIDEMGLKDNVIVTGFISWEDRNSLIKNCNTFLFPSVFEGFGIPPVEAMMLGARVISTKCTSLYEVTQNKCSYVEDPYDVEDWIKQIENIQNKIPKELTFKCYNRSEIARQYLDLFYEVSK